MYFNRPDNSQVRSSYVNFLPYKILKIIQNYLKDRQNYGKRPNCEMFWQVNWRDEKSL